MKGKWLSPILSEGCRWKPRPQQTISGQMDSLNRQAQRKNLRRSIQKQDIFVWVNSFLRVGIATNLRSFPNIEFFVPVPQQAT
jgi:hypothetical protein